MILGRAEKRNVAGRSSAPCAGRMKIDIIQTYWVLPVRRSDLKHHVILIQLSIDNRYLGLAKVGVQSAIESLRSQAELRRSCAIVGYIFIQAAVLLVGVDVLQTRQLLHLREQARSPRGKIGEIIRLNGVLIERIGRPAA